MQSLWGDQQGHGSADLFGLDGGNPDGILSSGSSTSGGMDLDLENFQLPPFPVDTLHSTPTHSPNLLNLHASDPFLVNPPRPPRGMHANPVPTCAHRPRCASPQQHINKLDEYILRLETIIRIKDTELTALRPRFDRLLTAVENLTPAPPQPAQAAGTVHQPSTAVTVQQAPTPWTIQQLPPRRKLKRSDYPLIKYWAPSDWKKGTPSIPVVPIDVDDKEANAMAGVPVWLQDMNGDIVTVEKLDAMRLAMRTVWHQMLDNHAAPLTWGKVRADVLRAFREIIYNEYPELELCDDHWKLQQLCSVGYPGWHSHYVRKKGVPVKDEPTAANIKDEAAETSLTPARASGGNKRKLSVTSSTASSDGKPQPVKKSRVTSNGAATAVVSSASNPAATVGRVASLPESGGRRVSSENPSTRKSTSHVHYDTIIQTAGVDIRGEIRIWAPDPILSDNTVVDILGKLYAPPNQIAWIDAIHMHAFPGDPSDPKYEDGIPDRPFPTLFVLGHTVGQPETMEDNLSLGYLVQASEYVRDASRSSRLYCRFDGSKPRWKKTPRPQAGTAVQVVGLAHGVHLAGGHVMVDVDQLQLSVGSASGAASSTAPRVEQGGTTAKRRRFQAVPSQQAASGSGPAPQEPASSGASASTVPGQIASPSQAETGAVSTDSPVTPKPKKPATGGKRKATSRFVDDEAVEE